MNTEMSGIRADMESMNARLANVENASRVGSPQSNGAMQLLEMNQAGSDLKVDDDDEVQKGYDSDDWLTLPNKDVFIKYYQQLRESDGFEFDEYPGSCMFAPIYPILQTVLTILCYLQWQSNTTLAMMEKNARLRSL